MDTVEKIKERCVSCGRDFDFEDLHMELDGFICRKCLLNVLRIHEVVWLRKRKGIRGQIERIKNMGEKVPPSLIDYYEVC
jgi:DNA-directed RNA polymerase subunit RPC12/RpoP